MAERRVPVVVGQLLKGALAVAAIAWLIRSGAFEPGQLEAICDRWGWMVAAAAAFGGAQVFAALRWRLLLRTQEIDASFGRCYELILVGFFFNQFLLGATGGDLVRAAGAAAQHPERATAAALSVGVDRAVGLSMLLVMAVVIGLLQAPFVLEHPELISVLVLAMAALVAAGALIAFGFWQRERGRVAIRRILGESIEQTLAEAIRAYGGRPGDLTRAAGLSVLVHLGTVTVNFCLAGALSTDAVDPVAFLLLIPVAHAAMAIPINPPGAIGTGEAIYAHLLQFVGYSYGGLVCMLQRGVFFVWSAPAILLWAVARRRGAVAESAEA